MEDILASIRRILSEDEAAAGEMERHGAVEPETQASPLHAPELTTPQLPPERQAYAPATPPNPVAPPPDVLALDESMLVPSGAPAASGQSAVRPETETRRPDPPRPSTEERSLRADTGGAPSAPSPDGSLVAPVAAAAAAASIGSLLRTLEESRTPGVLVTRAGVTLEDVVRDELRPLLKAWLDDQLPPLVERMVRAEIQRVIGRAHDS